MFPKFHINWSCLTIFRKSISFLAEMKWIQLCSTNIIQMASNFYQWFILANNNFPQVCTKIGINLRVENINLQRQKSQKTEEGNVPWVFCKMVIVSLLPGSSARGHGARRTAPPRGRTVVLQIAPATFLFFQFSGFWLL